MSVLFLTKKVSIFLCYWQIMVHSDLNKKYKNKASCCKIAGIHKLSISINHESTCNLIPLIHSVPSAETAPQSCICFHRII